METTFKDSHINQKAIKTTQDANAEPKLPPSSDLPQVEDAAETPAPALAVADKGKGNGKGSGKGRGAGKKRKRVSGLGHAQTPPSKR